MSFAIARTFKKLTAPGYFNFSNTQKPITGKIAAWFDAAMKVWSDQLNLFDSFFRLWNTHDYSTATLSRTPYVGYLLNQWGLGFFQGNDTQAVALIGYVKLSYPESVADSLFGLFDFLSQAPLGWIYGTPQIVYGHQIPAKFAETLIIFSNAGSLPATPAAQAYTPRAWTAPTGWSLTASSATYYSRGYLSSPTQITWMAPQSTSVATPFYDVLHVANLPASPATGSTGGVFDDGTGDEGAIYYYDGSQWRKNSTPNANQGQVTGGIIPDPRPSAVFAPNQTGPSLTSETPPPVSGPTQGFGMYAGLSSSSLRAREIDINIVLTADGYANLGIIVNLLRRIKPTLNRLIIFYTIHNVSSTIVTLEIKDSGALN